MGLGVPLHRAMCPHSSCNRLLCAGDVAMAMGLTHLCISAYIQQEEISFNPKIAGTSPAPAPPPLPPPAYSFLATAEEGAGRVTTATLVPPPPEVLQLSAPLPLIIEPIFKNTLGRARVGDVRAGSNASQTWFTGASVRSSAAIPTPSHSPTAARSFVLLLPPIS